MIKGFLPDDDDFGPDLRPRPGLFVHYTKKRVTKKQQKEWDNSRRDVRFGYEDKDHGELLGIIYPEFNKTQDPRNCTKIWEDGHKLDLIAGIPIEGRADRSEMNKVRSDWDKAFDEIDDDTWDIKIAGDSNTPAPKKENLKTISSSKYHNVITNLRARQVGQEKESATPLFEGLTVEDQNDTVSFFEELRKKTGPPAGYLGVPTVWPPRKDWPSKPLPELKAEEQLLFEDDDDDTF